MFKRLLAFVVIVFCITKIDAQTDTTQHYPKSVEWITDVAEWGIDLITFERENYTFFVIPMAGYEERTKFSFGVMPVWRFYLNNSDEDSEYFRPSNISPSVMVSTTGMYELDLSSGFYTNNNWLFENKWLFQFMPDRFYGIGNQDKGDIYSDFDMEKFEFTGTVSKGLSNTVFLGVNYDLGFFDISNISGTTLNQDVLGYEGGFVMGIGPTAYYDSRDNISYPSSGQYLAISYDYYFGDYDFSSFKIDARNYIKLSENDKVLAFQAYLNSAYGDVPFFRMPTLGGKRLFRGIDRPYKYMDTNVAYLQAEYRSPLWWRIGYVLNTGVGNVFNKWDNSIVEDVHVMFGAGFRFQLLPKEKLSFRADFGMTNRGDKGIYFTLGEAF